MAERAPEMARLRATRGDCGFDIPASDAASTAPRQLGSSEGRFAPELNRRQKSAD
jgi:hypothetical protein